MVENHTRFKSARNPYYGALEDARYLVTPNENISCQSFALESSLVKVCGDTQRSRVETGLPGNFCDFNLGMSMLIGQLLCNLTQGYVSCP